MNKEIEKSIEKKVIEARSKFELQKASIGKNVSISKWMESAFKSFYKKGLKDSGKK